MTRLQHADCSTNHEPMQLSLLSLVLCGEMSVTCLLRSSQVHVISGGQLAASRLTSSLLHKMKENLERRGAFDVWHPGTTSVLSVLSVLGTGSLPQSFQLPVLTAGVGSSGHEIKDLPLWSHLPAENRDQGLCTVPRSKVVPIGFS